MMVILTSVLGYEYWRYARFVVFVVLCSINLTVGADCGKVCGQSGAITLNRATGVVLAVLGTAILAVNYVQ